MNNTFNENTYWIVGYEDPFKKIIVKDEELLIPIMMPIANVYYYIKSNTLRMYSAYHQYGKHDTPDTYYMNLKNINTIWPFAPDYFQEHLIDAVKNNNEIYENGQDKDKTLFSARLLCSQSLTGPGKYVKIMGAYD
jgi:hypothetical protein